MISKYPKHSLSWLSIIAIAMISIVAYDDIVHHHDYSELAECKKIFHESCKLIAVPESVNGLLDGFK